MSDPIYTEEQARRFIAVAVRDGRCADLLNTLANGGAVTLDIDGPTITLVTIDEAQVAWLATGGRDGHP